MLHAPPKVKNSPQLPERWKSSFGAHIKCIACGTVAKVGGVCFVNEFTTAKVVRNLFALTPLTFNACNLAESNSEWAQLSTYRRHPVFNPTLKQRNRFSQQHTNKLCRLCMTGDGFEKANDAKRVCKHNPKHFLFASVSTCRSSSALFIPISWNIQCLKAEMKFICPISDV